MTSGPTLGLVVRAAALAALAGLATPAAAQQPAPAAAAAEQPAQATKPARQADADKSGADKSGADKDGAQRFIDAVTVSATLNPQIVKDTPGTVSVIDEATMQRRLIENTADLVKFEPGVYVESHPTRVGLNGFNIRGVGGNRVATRVDGVETSEQFDFGPFNVHQFALDLDTLKSAEIVRSAGSSLYGSDALGGVVSFFTKDPLDYLQGRRYHVAAKTLYDGRASDTSGNLVLAGGTSRVQASLFGSYAVGHEPGNKGAIASTDALRTAPNPQDRESLQALGKLVFTTANAGTFRATLEAYDQDIDTNAYSSRTSFTQGPITTSVLDITALDTMRRVRASIDHAVDGRFGMNQWTWSAFVQNTDTDQIVDEERLDQGFGPPVTVLRHGTLAFEQRSMGATLQARKLAMMADGLLFTFGGAYTRHSFDMLRDRHDVDAATGATIPASIVIPSKYFPRSDVDETGVYVQGELRYGALTVIPGIRYDRFSIDADQGDDVYVAEHGLPADSTSDAVSARIGVSYRVADTTTVHAQFAQGFRAPPYSAVNTGFTNLLAGYMTQPNVNLKPETSLNYEGGIRTAVGAVSFGATAFLNDYEDFIAQATLGFNPATGLLEFQSQNVASARIRGIELQGDARLPAGFVLRGAYAFIRGDDVTGDEEVPLQTIAPNQGVISLQYAGAAQWGGEFALRASAGTPETAAESMQFRPESFIVADLFGWATIGRNVTLRAGVLNLTDARYFEWSNVRGRQTGDAAIDRYSSPGISAILSIAYGW